MILGLIKLEVKQLFRSSNLAKNILVNIFAGFSMLFVLFWLFLIGRALPSVIQSLTGSDDVFYVVNTYLAHFFLMEILLRYFFQKVPGANISPFIHLPVPKSLLTFWLLLKSLISPMSLLVLAVFLPFARQAVIPFYGSTAGFLWLGTLLAISFTLHWLVILLKLKTEKGFRGFLLFLAVIALVLGMDHFGYLAVLTRLHPFFEFAASSVIPFVVLLLVMLFFFLLVFRSFKLHTHLEDDVKKVGYNFYNYAPGILSRFGFLGDIAILEWRLILRHKRSRNLLFTGLIFLTYGMIFYTNPQYFNEDGSISTVLILPAIFITGTLAMQFGQLFISWNSSHFDFFMNKPDGISSLIRGKYLLYMLAVSFMLILSLPYAYFGWQILYLHLAAFLYNVGVNLNIIVWLALWQPKPINLNAGGTWNMEGMGCAQFLLAVPVLGVPLIIVAILSFFFSQVVAFIVIGGIGLIGLILFPYFSGLAVKKVIENRYNISSTFRKES
ncbi:DUF5687 family protein [Natronoflexus pectinivorans]|uniref:ABC-2 type transport system permease protein n=1 Tax=Natronoflexus pectinivorans TaxID=682526 RepID=A0A4R2GHV8_9BACT|nr:DUF5687 family protein [Natronoflexus pectinivorans]TCO08027.1 hypothetical protein EV194_106169 [Natronoflexus pectinivorans]